MRQYGKHPIRVPTGWKPMPPEADKAMHDAAEAYAKKHGSSMTLGGLYRAMWRAAPKPERTVLDGES